MAKYSPIKPEDRWQAPHPNHLVARIHASEHDLEQRGADPDYHVSVIQNNLSRIRQGMNRRNIDLNTLSTLYNAASLHYSVLMDLSDSRIGQLGIQLTNVTSELTAYHKEIQNHSGGSQ